MSETIFWRAFDRAVSLDRDFPVDLVGRWIKPVSEADAALMARAVTQSIKLSTHHAALMIRHENVNRFAVSGFDEPDVVPEYLERVEATPGLFGLFVVETGLSANATVSQIKEHVLGEGASDSDYEGHDLEQLERLFPKIYFYDINEEYIHASWLNRIVGAYIARAYSNAPLRLGENCKEKFEELFISGDDRIPFDRVLQSLLSFSWQSLFLELYRCIEYLYPMPKALLISQEWKEERTLTYIHSVLEEKLGWKPKEEDAIAMLFEHLELRTCAAILRNTNNAIENPAGARSARSASRRIYALRNACVHYRPATDLGSLRDDQWNAIAIAMIEAIQSLYERYGARLLG